MYYSCFPHHRLFLLSYLSEILIYILFTIELDEIYGDTTIYSKILLYSDQPPGFEIGPIFGFCFCFVFFTTVVL